MSEHTGDITPKRPRKALIKEFVGVMSGNTAEDDKKQLDSAVIRYAETMRQIKIDLVKAGDGPANSPLEKKRNEIQLEYGKIGNTADDKKTKKIGKLIDELQELKGHCEKAAKLQSAKDEYSVTGAVGPKEYKERLGAVLQQLDEGNHRVEELSDAELVCIRTYTLATGIESWKEVTDLEPPYKDMNRLLRGEECRNYPLEKIQDLVRITEQAMQKLPNYTGSKPTFRKDFVRQNNELLWPGWENDYERYQIGAVFTTPCFWSTGKTGSISGIAQEWVEWTVETVSGKDIDKFSRMKSEGGGEVLLPKGINFTVTGRSLDVDVNLNTRVWKMRIVETLK